MNRTGGVLVVWSTWTISAVISRKGRLLTITRGYSTGAAPGGGACGTASWGMSCSANRASAIVCACSRMGSIMPCLLFSLEGWVGSQPLHHLQGAFFVDGHDH